MPPVLGIKFSPDSCAQFFLLPEGLEPPLAAGDFCVVEDGQQSGQMRMGFVSSFEGRCACQAERLPRVVRRAHPSEVERWQEELEQHAEVLQMVRQQVEELALGMKIIGLEPGPDQLRVLFTAEGRVDFRPLVRVVGRQLNRRIEFWQINPRQASARLDGYGPCGQRQCCSAWQRRSPMIGFRALRESGDLNHHGSAASGMCGRLRCCLRHEECDRKKRDGRTSCEMV